MRILDRRRTFALQTMRKLDSGFGVARRADQHTAAGVSTSIRRGPPRWRSRQNRGGRDTLDRARRDIRNSSIGTATHSKNTERSI